MAIAYVNGNSFRDAASGGTVACAAINASAGNTIVACVSNYGNALITGIADTAGNHYDICGISEQGGDANHRMEIWVATNIAANASNVVTATFASSVPYRNIGVVQYSGLAASNVYDVSATKNSDTGETAHATNSATGNQADEVYVGFFVPFDATYAYSASAPSNIRVTEAANNFVICDQIVSSIGSYSVAVNTASANQLIGIMRTFKAASSAGMNISDARSQVIGRGRSSSDSEGISDSSARKMIYVRMPGSL